MALALYRRYRPDTFDGVIGQQQVTVPLCRALDNNKLTHAYLFSGPRGCGKTSSARILARCVNCAKGPTSHPCGECDSCRELAANGPGSIDVLEIDAASHNGVEDARELRDRVGFGPTRDRYKIIILDEAHMVTPQGFNALLKTVEEPPDDVMFIFATTEPDKVLGTIRSRTHHYPFRLVPPEIMGPYLEHVCSEEGIKPEPGVLRLTMRAGGGSVRDTLSVLDQLMAGADGNVITYESAVRLLGFTPDTLIGEAVDAVIESDGARLYGIVNKVVVGGYDPRKFVEDLLARVRDLIVLTLAGAKGESALSDDVRIEDSREIERQAKALGLPKLTWMAETINDSLGEMAGAISPRMRLELLAAKLLVPAGEPGRAPQPAGAAGQASSPTPAQSARRGIDSQGSGQNARRRETPQGAGAARDAAPVISGANGLSAALSAMASEMSDLGTSTAPRQTDDPAQRPAQPSAPSDAVDATAFAASPQEQKRTGTLPQTLVSSQTLMSQTDATTGANPSPQTGASPANPASNMTDDERWDATVASLPAEAQLYLNRTQIPYISVQRDSRNPQRGRVSLTFSEPLAQRAFSLANVDGKSVVAIVSEAVHRHFSPQDMIAPAAKTADGQTVVPLQRLSPDEQKTVRREVAMYNVKLKNGATLSSASTLAKPTRPQGRRESEDDAAASGASAGVLGASADGADDPDGAGGAGGHGSQAAPSGDAVVDPWANEPDLSEVVSPKPAEHHHKHVAVPDATNDVDPWSNSFPAPGQSPQQQSRQQAGQESAPQEDREVARPDGVNAPAPAAAEGLHADGSATPAMPRAVSPGNAQGMVHGPAAPGGQPDADGLPAGFDPAGFSGAAPRSARTAPPSQVRQYGGMAPEGSDAPQPDSPDEWYDESEYSLDDKDLGEGISIEEIGKMFDAKEITEETQGGEGNGTV